jgi:hypothetical protein
MLMLMLMLIVGLALFGLLGVAAVMIMLNKLDPIVAKIDPRM